MVIQFALKSHVKCCSVKKINNSILSSLMLHHCLAVASKMLASICILKYMQYCFRQCLTLWFLTGFLVDIC